jgi:rubrerythrin
MKTLSQDILSEAIQFETQTRNFYRIVSERIGNKRGRSQVKTLVKEEDRHRKILEKRYTKLFSSPFAQEELEPLPESKRILDHATLDKATALEVASVSIGIENKAIDFYTKHLETVDDPTDKKILTYLIAFEEKHKARFQAEYDKLGKALSPPNQIKGFSAFDLYVDAE